MSWYCCLLYVAHLQRAVCSHAAMSCPGAAPGCIYPALPIAAATPQGTGHHPGAVEGHRTGHSPHSALPRAAWMASPLQAGLTCLPLQQPLCLCGTAHSSFPAAVVSRPRNPSVTTVQPPPFAGNSWWYHHYILVLLGHQSPSIRGCFLGYYILPSRLLLSLHPVVLDEAIWGDSLMSRAYRYIGCPHPMVWYASY